MAVSLNCCVTTRRTIALIFLALLAVPITVHAAKGTITGTCRVEDGDTIWVHGQGDPIEVRLNGVAAPEKKEPGGKQATAYLKTVCEGQPVKCELDGSKTRGREVGICYVKDATDIGAAVISVGLARDCTRFSGGRYADFEKPEAKYLAFPGYCSPR
jgi:micrococcal nuclease